MMTEQDILRQVDPDLTTRTVQDCRVRDLIWPCIEWVAFILLLSWSFVFLVECCSPLAGVIPDFLTSLESKGNNP